MKQLQSHILSHIARECGLLFQAEYSMACLSVEHDRESCKSGMTDRDAIWEIGMWTQWTTQIGGPYPSIEA